MTYATGNSGANLLGRNSNHNHNQQASSADQKL